MKKEILGSFFLILLNLILIFSVLYIYELLLSDKPKHGRFGTGVHYTWGHEVVYNSIGFREREIPEEKPKDQIRVMVLGDSLTFGEGLSVGERYTNIAEEFIGTSTQKNVLIYNFGLNGIPTVQEKKILEDNFQLVDPDLVVLGFCLNDTQPRSQRYSSELEQFNESLPGKFTYAFSASLRKLGFRSVSRQVNSVSILLLEKLGVIPSWWDALDRTYERSSTEWMEFKEALRDIHQFTVNNYIGPPVFLILNQGTSTLSTTDYANPGDNELLLKYLDWYAQVESVASEIGFEVHDFQEELGAMEGPKVLAVNKYDAHPSAEMNKIFGIKLADILKERLNLDSL